MTAERKLHEMITEAKANFQDRTQTGSAMFGDALVVFAVCHPVTETMYFVKKWEKIERCSNVDILHAIKTELNRIKEPQ